VDLQWLIPLGTFLTTVVGAGAWKLIDRADKKRLRRDEAVEALLKSQYAKLEAERDRLRIEHDAKVAKIEADAAQVEARLRRENARLHTVAGKWREQLIAAGIHPDPADWPEESDD
jgi:hypothetical protein